MLGTTVENVGAHLKDIDTEGELDEAGATEDSSVVRTEGNKESQAASPAARPRRHPPG
jgi:hypothetical protein